MLIHTASDPVWERGLGASMEILSDSFPVQYAVIQLHQSDGGIERFVIGYQGERNLRQFLDKRSIVATGFVSRDEATKESLTAGIGNRGPLLNLICRFRVSGSFYQLRMLKMRTLRRLQGRDSARRVMNNFIHLAGTALHKIQSRLPRGRRRLEPSV